MSIPKWKLSHYILPAYPTMACLAAIQIVKAKDSIKKSIAVGAKYLFAIAALVLLFFPLTNKIRRDRDIYKVQELTTYLKEKPNQWGLIGDAYDYWSMATAIEFTSGLITHRLSIEKLMDKSLFTDKNKWIYCLKQEVYELTKDSLPNLVPFYRSGNMVFLIEKKLTNNEFLLERHN